MVDKQQQPQDACNEDQDIKKLFDWVERHGGKHQVCVRRDKNGIRGLYSGRDFNLDPEALVIKKKIVEQGHVHSLEQDEDDVLIKIPNKLLVTPYHIAGREVGKGIKYNQVFQWAPELFDSKYPYKQS